MESFQCKLKMNEAPVSVENLNIRHLSSWACLWSESPSRLCGPPAFTCLPEVEIPSVLSQPVCEPVEAGEWRSALSVSRPQLVQVGPVLSSLGGRDLSWDRASCVSGQSLEQFVAVISLCKASRREWSWSGDCICCLGFVFLISAFSA